MDMQERLGRIEPFLTAGDFAAVAAILTPSAPVDIGELLSLIDESYIPPILTYFPQDIAGEVIAHLDPALLPQIIRGLGDEKAANILDTMYLDDVTDLLAELTDEEQRRILSLMEHEDAQGVQDLLVYPADTAGSIMTTEYVALNQHVTAAEAIDYLRSKAPSAEMVYYVYVVDDDNLLVGVLSLRDLIVTPPTWQLENIMNPRVKSVTDYMDQEEVINVASRYDIMAVPVVDRDHRLLGIVTIDDIIDAIEEEQTEDTLRMGGVFSDEDDEDVLSARLSTAVRSRLPWLLVTLFGGVLSGLVIRNIENELQVVVALAYFTPLLCGMGGSVGTQSATVTVRALATGQIGLSSNKLLTVFKELSVGLVVGVCCAVLITVVVTLWQHSFVLGFIVGASLLCNMTIAATIGTAVPLVLKKLNFDPAVSSAPFISTSLDIISLLIYSLIAAQFIPLLV